LVVPGETGLAELSGVPAEGSGAYVERPESGVSRLVVDVEVGFSGVFVESRYNPLFLRLSSVRPGQRASVAVSLLGREGIFGDPSQARKPLATNEFDVVIPGGGRPLSVPVLMRPDAVRLSVVVALDDGRTGDRTVELDEANHWMALVLTERRPELAFLAEAFMPSVFPEPGELPGDWRAYDCVGLIVLDDLDIRDLDAEVVRAIEAAVAWGTGVLVTGPGLAANAGAPVLGPLAELEVIGELGPIHLPELEQWFLPSARDAGALTPLGLLELSGDQHSALVTSNGRSIILEEDLLRSSLVVCAFDPVHLAWEKEAASYATRSSCWQQLRIGTDGRGAADLYIGQVLGSLVPDEGRIRGRAAPIGVLLGVFAVILGPVNFLVIRRARRREWMLLTVPGAVVIFLIAAAAVFRTAIPERDVLCAATVVQATPGSEAAVEACYFGVLPRGQGPQEVVIAPRAKVAPPDRDMRPWDELGGIEARPIHTSEGFGLASVMEADGSPLSARTATPIRLGNVWQRPRAMRFFASGWLTSVAAPQAEVELVGDSLAGRFTNTFDETLRGVTAALGWRRTALGDVSPGETVSFTLPVGLPERFLRPDRSAIDYMSDIAWLDPSGECLTCGLVELDTAEDTLIAEESRRAPGIFGQPVVLGWGGEDAPVSRPDAELRSRRLYLMPIPVTPIEGAGIVVPPGLVRPDKAYTRIGIHLAETPANEVWDGGVYVFRPPVVPGGFSDCALTVYAYGAAPGWVSDPRPARLAALNWEKGVWQEIDEPVVGFVEHVIDDAARFVKEPEGWVAIARNDPWGRYYDSDWEEWGGYYPVGLTYLDVRLEGRR
jgi:hypothetical protein